MPRFFLPKGKIGTAAAGDRIVIDGADARHIASSLRMRAGDPLTVCDREKTDYACRILSIEKVGAARAGESEVTLEVISVAPTAAEPSFCAVLYQALPKGDKFDVIVQKAVETGVTAIVPFLSDRCISRPDAAAAARKCERWQKIAEEAAKQCGRGIVPQIGAPLSFGQAVEAAARSPLALLCYEGSGTVPLGRVIDAHPHGSEISFLIGAEGGFSEEEADHAVQHGLLPVGLGARILRCETASSFVLSCLTYAYDLQ